MTAMKQLRVLMVGPLGPPHVYDQALALKERGIDVHVGGNASAALADSALAEAGLPVRTSPMSRRSTPWGIAATIRWTRRSITAVRPDIVHAHWLPGFGFAAAAAGASPLALTAWGSDVYRASRVQKVANRYALRRADLLMADSQHLLEACRAHKGHTPRTELVQWGADLRMFRPASAEERAELRRRLGLGPGPVIISPRTLTPVYNIPVVIEAFGRVGSAVPDAQLLLKHMGGATIELPPFPHPERVHLIGRVPYEKMADYYRVADVCVSISSSDSSPRSVWEAMAAGCACVLSDLPWVTELLVPGRDAVTVPVDPIPVADAIVRLLSDPGLRDQVAANGRSVVETHLDREREMDRLVELYAELADR
jgi:glycosyltransferase involved in cell wall biosynthesis